MKISVALCTYNGKRFLEQQLESIATQQHQPFELVICDDGSTDTTEQIVEAFRSVISFPVSFHRNPVNLGSTKNFEKAIQLCRGDAIALCDQDDCWAPEKLAAMSAVLESDEKIAGVFSNANLLDQDGNIVQGDLWTRAKFTPDDIQRFARSISPRRLMTRDTVTGATLLFRATYRSQLLPISPEWVHDGWIAMILASVAELRPFPACPMSYRLHATQQIGLNEVPWHAHLTTRKEKAVAEHTQRARRVTAMLARLEILHVDASILAALRYQASFHMGRAEVLRLPRARRFTAATRLLRGYFTEADGVVSLLRDLLH